MDSPLLMIGVIKAYPPYMRSLTPTTGGGTSLRSSGFKKSVSVRREAPEEILRSFRGGSVVRLNRYVLALHRRKVGKVRAEPTCPLVILIALSLYE